MLALSEALSAALSSVLAYLRRREFAQRAPK